MLLCRRLVVSVMCLLVCVGLCGGAFGADKHYEKRRDFRVCKIVAKGEGS